MFLVHVYITPKESVLDPQGKVVMASLQDTGEKNVVDVRIGKYVQLKINNPSLKECEEEVIRMIEKLLINPVIESYSYKIEKTSG